MPSRIGWAGPDFHPFHHEHIVQLYQHESDLERAVATYAFQAAEHDDAVLFVATRDHADTFRRGLAAQGMDVEAAAARGQLVFVHVEDIMPRFMRGAMPDATTFKTVVNDLLDSIQRDGRFRHVYVFGEIVNVLWQQGNRDGTLLVEQLWGELQQARPFTLYCGFQVDRPPLQLLNGPMHDVLATHSAVVSAIDHRPGPGPRGVFVELAELNHDDARDLGRIIGDLSP